MRRIKIHDSRFLEASIHLKLQTLEGNEAFRGRLALHIQEHGVTLAEIMRGLSASSIKTMRRGELKVPAELPWLIASVIWNETRIDITPLGSLSAFYALGFDIQLAIDVETRNPEHADHDLHDLKNFHYEIHEAKTIAVSPDDKNFELDLRIGFDRTRLTLRATGLRTTDNRLTGELPLDPSDPCDSDYQGWFDMRLGSRVPLSWFFDPKTEGEVLKGRVYAQYLGRVETNRGSPLTAEITARRDALKVRIVDETGQQKSSKSLTDQHRDKMCEAVARRSFAGSVDEFVIHRLPLVLSNREDK